MRLNWFAEPVVISFCFFSLLFLLAAHVFTMRPKLDVTTARQTRELANLRVTTDDGASRERERERRVQGRGPPTTETQPAKAGKGIGGGWGGVILPVELIRFSNHSVKNPLGWRSLRDPNATVR